MLAYILIFSLLGFLIGRFLSRNNGVILIVSLSILWGISSAPVWGLASLGEMLLGFYISQISSRQ